MSSSSRSRSSAPTPHFEPPQDPPKPLISSLKSRYRSVAPSPFPQPPEEDVKPSQAEIKDEPDQNESLKGDEGFRRSMAPEYEYGMGQWVEGKVWDVVKDEVKEEEREGEMGPPSSTFRRSERERTWTPIIGREGEYGGGYDDDEQGQAMEGVDTPRFGSVSTLFSRNEEDQDDEDRDGREIDYGSEQDEDGREGTVEAGMTPEVESEEEEESQESEEDSSDGGRKKKKKARVGGHLTSEKRKRRGKGKKGREPKKSKKELEKERIEQAAQLTSDFFSQLPMDPPQPALISIKARLTNTVAASTTHLPLRHQVLTVRQPSPRRRRTPTPPVVPSRSASPTLEPEDIHQARRNSTQSRLTPSTFEDELEDYEEDPLPPPEDLLDGFGAKPKVPLDHDFASEVDRPRKLESRAEAIGRWKLEIGLESSNARPVPESYSWISYRQTHKDLLTLLPSLDPPLPPLLSLPRLFEAHPSLLTHLPPTPSQSHSIWSAIFSSEPLKIDSDSRLNRACWQLTEFSDRDGMERIEKDADREGVGLKEFEGVAREVLEFEGSEFGFDWEKITERNSLIAQQIVQLARIHKAFLRLSSPEILDTFTSARHERLQRLSTDLEKVKKEYAEIDKKYIGNSQWILKLREQMESIESEMQETRTKFDRLEQNLRSVR